MLDEGATFLELAEFTQKYSDNAAANLLMGELGGPAAVTAFRRGLGDDVSRLDRTEPALNFVPSGELRDKTTPAAMARTLAAILYGSKLHPTLTATLKAWMADTPTGARRVRAGLPESWRAGYKTGTAMAECMGSAYVDIGFIEILGGPSLTSATYLVAEAVHDDMDSESEAVLAEVGGRIAATYGA